MTIEMLKTTEAPGAVGPYSQAVRTGDLIFVSGQLGLDPHTGQLVSGVEAQADRALKNIAAILKSVGLDLSAVVKATVLLDDMDDFAAVNGVYAENFGDHRPARAAYAVQSLPLGGLVEIEAIAVAK